MPVPPSGVREVILGRNESVLRGRMSVYRSDTLPQNAVHAAFQDSRDYLWFATQEGVVRFDGGEWKPYRMSEGLVYNFVQAIAEDHRGRLWFGSRIGLSRFDPIRLRSTGWRSYGTADGLPDVHVRAIATDGEGAIWIGTRRGLTRHNADDETFDSWGEQYAPACSEVSAVITDANGRIWIGSNVAGVASFDPASGRWRAYENAPRQVSCLALDATGHVWIGTLGQGAARLDPATGSLTRITTADGLANPVVLSILCDSQGDTWFGTGEAGLSCLRAGSGDWIDVSVEDGLADFTVLSLLEDRGGLLWIGALGGLTCFQREGTYRAKTWQTFTHGDGLAHDLVACICEASDGRYWFGTFGRGVSSLAMRDGEAIWRSYDTRDGLTHNVVRALAEDRRKRIWLGTFGGGLSCFDPTADTWRTVGVDDGLAGTMVRCIREDSDGIFWVATDGGGLSLFDPCATELRFTNHDAGNGLTSNRVSTIVHGREATFVGTYDGGLCVRHPDGTWTSIGREDGLAAGDVYSVAEDTVGRLWVGSGGSGLTLIDGSNVRVFTERDGLPNDVIYQILIESEHSIYCSTNRGVFRLRLDGTEMESIISFDRTDGLGEDEANGGASMIDRQGRFWIGTIGGVSFIDPRGVPQSIPPCPVFITGFTVHDQPYDLSGLAVIEDSQYEVVFHYGAIEYVSPQKVRYRSRLAGLESNWSKVSTQRQIRYTNLRPGRYTFQVQARNWGGLWSEPAELSFEVIPDRERVAREEAIEQERIEKKVLEAAHVQLQRLAEELRVTNEKLREQELLLELEAREDPLTGLANRRHLDERLRQEYDRAVRFKRPLTIAIADLDHFKEVNDGCGHAAGDEVLRAAADVLRAGVRAVDFVARYGGEEFVLLLPETGEEAALLVCEKIRCAIANHRWMDIDPRLAVTVSIGLTGDVGAGSPEKMLLAADTRLFAAKRGGRNRCIGGP